MRETHYQYALFASRSKYVCWLTWQSNGVVQPAEMFSEILVLRNLVNTATGKKSFKIPCVKMAVKESFQILCANILQVLRLT